MPAHRGGGDKAGGSRGCSNSRLVLSGNCRRGPLKPFCGSELAAQSQVFFFFLIYFLIFKIYFGHFAWHVGS